MFDIVGTLGSLVGMVGDAAQAGSGYFSPIMSHALQLYGNKKMMRYSREQNERYNSWLIPFQNNESYKYQMRYLKNSPSANVKGLRNAGLNPILAASGGFHTSTPSGASGGNGSSPLPVSAQKFQSLLDVQNQIKQNELLDSQIEGQKIRNTNDSMNRGLSGRYGAYSRLISEASHGLSTRPQGYENVMDSINKVLGTYIGNRPSTDKSKSPASDLYRPDGSSYDTPPAMNEWQKSVNTDGFNSRIWSRSSKKYDGKHRYEKRQHWKTIYTR